MVFRWTLLGLWDFSCVAVKGGALCDFVPVQREARLMLNAWLDAQQDEAPTLFPTRSSDHPSYRRPDIWRYVKPDRQTLAEAIDELE